MTSGIPLLELCAVNRIFGGLRAVDAVSFTVARGAVVGLIGPNGAGKTTLLNLITATLPLSSGRILLDGRDISTLRPYRMAAQGIARTWQNPRLFGAMSVLDNVVSGMHCRTRSGLLAGLLGLPRARAEEQAALARARTLLDDVALGHAAAEPATILAYGDQKRLELARALATEPRLLLLDEPAAGLNSTEKQGLATVIGRLRAQGMTIVLIEHDMRMVMSLCDELVVLDHGQTIAQGDPASVRADPRVVAAYLGSQGNGLW